MGEEIDIAMAWHDDRATAPVLATAERAPHWYTIGGLPVLSDMPLPIPSVASVEGVTPAWVIRRVDAPPPYAPPKQLGSFTPWAERSAGDDEGSDRYIVYRSPNGTLWWWGSRLMFHISSDARRVDVYDAMPESDQRIIGLALTSAITAFVLNQLGHPTLHATAVVTGGKAVAFMGAKGQGKSTMAAAFLRRGAALLADDLLLLSPNRGDVYGAVGPPTLRLWLPTVEHTLGLEPESLPDLADDIDKKLLVLDGRYPTVRQPVRLDALYVLDRRVGHANDRGEIVSRDLNRQESLAVVLANISSGAHLSAAEVGCFFPLFGRLIAQAAVRVLSYPTSFDRQDAVCEHILREVGD